MPPEAITTAINNNLNYICGETLANTLVFSDAKDFDGKNLVLINELFYYNSNLLSFC